jgi:hypothetical protein
MPTMFPNSSKTTAGRMQLVTLERTNAMIFAASTASTPTTGGGQDVNFRYIGTMQ